MSRVIHFELPADDPARAIKFYEQVFAWKFEKWQGPMEYWLITTGPEGEPGIDGGLAPRTDPATGTESTIGVSDIDAVVEKIEASGGKILRPKTAVHGIGWLAHCQDTEGNTFGIMQDDPEAS